MTFFGLAGVIEDDRTGETNTAFMVKEECERFVAIKNAMSVGMEFFCVEMPALEID